ncbi:hypothetical protein SLEP1_g52408 [Rubroshorea leprosula]|uniref:Uncharacterized protein n=1 Tax=Rubroshorea leprosula TaxID=152421 RepID=A0AAV5M8T0_9ROSI|nr:hypothetical protein SLEP1_g52408 [Rubroshorea leprosula]
MGFVFSTVKMVSVLVFSFVALNCLVEFGSYAQLLPEAEEFDGNEKKVYGFR